MSDLTALIVTSPTVSDPSLVALDETASSIRYHLPSVPMIIAADGVRPCQRALTDAYADKVAALRFWAGSENAAVLEMQSWGHQANTLRAALAEVTTPFVLFAEHDTPLWPDPILWTELCAALNTGELDLVRFHHESRVLPEHAHLMLDTEPRRLEGTFPYLRTAQWSQRPHVTRTDWYRQLLDTYFATSSRTMIEDVMHGVCSYYWTEQGEHGWRQCKMALHAHPDPSIERSYHLDGRGSSPKYEMTWAYPGDVVPEGAPQATRLRYE